MLGFEPSRTARLLEDILSEIGSSHHPVRERLVIVTSENYDGTLSHSAPRNTWVRTTTVNTLIAPPSLTWQIAGDVARCVRRRVRVWCIARGQAHALGGQRTDLDLLPWFSRCCQALEVPSNGACRTLVPIAREDGAWWGVPPLRSKIGRRTKGTRTGGESARSGQCGTANLHCGSGRDSGRMGVHDLDRRNWRIHPLLAQLGAMPYNCRIAAGPPVVRALEGNIWRLRDRRRSGPKK